MVKLFAATTAILLSLVPASASLGILLPLNEYPGTSASAWANATAAIAAYPKVQWQVILSLDSGPGTSTYPTDPNFISGIAKLNSYHNVITLGYIDTALATRPYTTIESEIAKYANWANYEKANISIGGIFFDHVVPGTPPPSRNTLEYYRNISTYTYARVPSKVTPIVFNPGALGSQQYFEYSNTVVEVLTAASSYHNDTTIKTIPAADRGQSAVVVYNANAKTNVKNLVHTLIQYGVGQVYIDYGECTFKGQATGCYSDLNAAKLMTLAAAVAAG